MSKDSSSSGKLLGTIKFVFDKTKSRTLNATQAYDVSTSQIVLASYPAKATKKAPAKSLEDPTSVPFELEGTVGVTATAWPAVELGFLGKADREESPIIFTSSANVSFGADRSTGTGGLTKSKIEVAGAGQASTVLFGGTSTGSAGLPLGAATKSNANKEIYYGAITVAIGEYRTWQGKYAVLKVDLLTDKAILRVYNQ